MKACEFGNFLKVAYAEQPESGVKKKYEYAALLTVLSSILTNLCFANFVVDGFLNVVLVLFASVIVLQFLIGILGKTNINLSGYEIIRAIIYGIPVYYMIVNTNVFESYLTLCAMIFYLIGISFHSRFIRFGELMVNKHLVENQISE